MLDDLIRALGMHPMYRLRHKGVFARRKNLARNVEGVTALEFAFVAPVLLLLMMGIVEFSLIMFTMAVMESATNNTARTGKTGYVAAGLTRQQEIINTVTARTGAFLDPHKIAITTLVYSNFDKIGQPEPCITVRCSTGAANIDYQDINGNNQWDADMGAAGLGNAGDVVVYTVSYPWPIFTPIIRAFLGSTYTIKARAVVKNEPY